MGVRTYTQFVTSLPRSSPAHSSAASNVVVDWSDLAPSADGVQVNIEDLLKWVNSYPRKSQIQVYLPSVRHRATMQKLQRSLLSMGCIVTCRFRPA
jgi:hypothetical protein